MRIWYGRASAVVEAGLGLLQRIHFHRNLVLNKNTTMVSTSVSTITIYFSESYEISFNPSDKVSPSIEELRQVLLNDRKRMSALSQTVVGQHYSPRPCGASVFSRYPTSMSGDKAVAFLISFKISRIVALTSFSLTSSSSNPTTKSTAATTSWLTNAPALFAAWFRYCLRSSMEVN